MISKTFSDFFPQYFPQFTFNQQVSFWLASISHIENRQRFPKIVVEKRQNRLRSSKHSTPLHSMTNQTPEVTLRTVDIAGLRALLSLGRTATYEITREAGFPQAFGISARHFLWDQSEVEAWVRSRRGLKPSPRDLGVGAKRVEVINGIRFEKVSA